MAGDGPVISQEGRDLLTMYAAQTQAAILQSNQSMQENILRQITAIELRLGTRLDRIETEQREQRKVLEDMGKEVVEIKTRLNEGDKRFDRVDSQIEDLDKEIDRLAEIIAAQANEKAALEQRVKRLEADQSETNEVLEEVSENIGKQGKSLAAMAGAALGGGGIGAAVMRYLGG